MGDVSRYFSQVSGSGVDLTLLNTVALHSVALRFFPGFEGVSQENRATPREKGPVAPTFSALKGGVALQITSWKVSGYRGCRSYTVACRAAMSHLVKII